MNIRDIENNMEKIHIEQDEFVKNNYREALAKVINKIGFDKYRIIESFETEDIADAVGFILAKKMLPMLKRHDAIIRRMS
ncbi:MAG: hypothetical protein GY714_20895 [Desulfobacterales bacterium]|nr:hypothetical protein [Desulfobacterales bacterium]